MFSRVLKSFKYSIEIDYKSKMQKREQYNRLTIYQYLGWKIFFSRDLKS